MKKETEKSKKSDDQILVTRAILEDVKQHLNLHRTHTDEQMLAWMRQMTGRPVKLVEEMPTDDDLVVICSLVPVMPDSRLGKCGECGAPVYHSRHVPPEAKMICTRCGPRLGH
jgi:formylmethanofuran dehydrogenase subunit E